MNLNTVLFDRSHTLRSGWRFAVFVFAFVFAGFVIGTAVSLLLSAVAPPGQRTAAFLTINGLASLLAALLVGWLCGKYLERLPFGALGASPVNGWLRNLFFGAILGAGTFATAALVGAAGGGLGFRLNAESAPASIATTLIISFCIFAAAAAFEEALFRGYILQTFVRSDLAVFGSLLTSALFASVHNANPNATVLSWVNTFLAGVWFAVAYLKTRDLWLPFGLHLAWNWTQGSIFGVEVSGLTEIVPAPIMRETDAGPAWLTGGEYGIEGGVACTIGILVSIAVLYFLPLRKAGDPAAELPASRAEMPS